jgi:glycosyltransferase involved in cell wall biosynthesis
MKRPVIGMVLNTMGHGGVTEVALQFARHLPRSDFAVKLCVMKKDDGENAGRLKRFHEMDVSVHFATEGAGKFDIVAAVADWIGQAGIDILHTQSFRPNLYARLAGMLSRPSALGIIAHYHNQYDDKWDRDPTLLALERHMAAGTDAMIAVSRSVRDHIAERLGRDAALIDVVSNGVEQKAFNSADRQAARQHFGLAADDLVFAVIGRVCEQKGQDLFVTAAMELATELPEARFLIIGDEEDGKLCSRLRQSIESRGLIETIRFTGHQSDMAQTYAALDIVVAPSRWEGFGLMLVEAMAAGKPVLATDVGAIAEVMGPAAAGHLILPNDSAALANAMRELAHDAALRHSLAAAGLVRQQAFSWHTSTESLAGIYRRVLEIRTRG